MIGSRRSWNLSGDCDATKRGRVARYNFSFAFAIACQRGSGAASQHAMVSLGTVRH